MFSERIKELFDTLGVSNQAISQCAGCTPPTISRLRSGARKPSPNSPTVDKLIEGTIQYASTNGLLPELAALVEVDDVNNLESGLRKWLFDESDMQAADIASETSSSTSSSRPSFSEKLDAIMKFSDMSNIKLARLVNIDTSYVSRFRNGIRSPKSNPELLDRICNALFEHVASKEMLPELSELINIPASSLYDRDNNIKTDELYMHFHAWMDDFSSSDHDAIKHLLGTIDTYAPNFDIFIPPLPQIVSDRIIREKKDIYLGIKGLQRAVLRFLGNAVKYHYEELELYSDQGMEWMTDDEDFRKRWSALMVLCVKQGTHIKIIHNIDRDISEMIQAVESWLPLYTSGMIESYYNKKACGIRFKHTIFLCPGKACISACHTIGTDDNNIYHYYTEPVYLESMKNNYDSLMVYSDPLVTIDQNTVPEAHNDIISQNDYSNISLSISQNKVIVIKNSAPKLIITFTHPLMCKAVEAYVKFSNENNNY